MSLCIEGAEMSKELLLEPSYKCYYNCIHCSSAGCSGKIELSDLDDFKDVIDDIDVVRLSGGEPTLLPNLNEFVDYFYDRGIKVILQTNGCIPIPDEIYNKLHKIYLSLYSDKNTHDFITKNGLSYQNCIMTIEEYQNVVLCSPMFSVLNAVKVITIAKKYDLEVRFTALLNHGYCNFAFTIEEQKAAYELVRKQYDKIIPHCSLTGECEMDKKYVIMGDLSLTQCASTKHGTSVCKNSKV